MLRAASEADLGELARWEEANSSGALWSLSDLQQEFAHPSSTLLVAADGAALLGYAVIREMPDGFELLNILVRADRRRLGTGGTLMQGIHERAGGQSVYLELRASNEAAAALYEGYGYMQVGLRERYYSDGEDAVLLMRLAE
jgi:ribosomal-protein-alanine N-acetyltransferase